MRDDAHALGSVTTETTVMQAELHHNLEYRPYGMSGRPLNGECGGRSEMVLCQDGLLCMTNVWKHRCK